MPEIPFMNKSSILQLKKMLSSLINIHISWMITNCRPWTLTALRTGWKQPRPKVPKTPHIRCLAKPLQSQLKINLKAKISISIVMTTCDLYGMTTQTISTKDTHHNYCPAVPFWSWFFSRKIGFAEITTVRKNSNNSSFWCKIKNFFFIFIVSVRFIIVVEKQ